MNSFSTGPYFRRSQFDDLCSQQNSREISILLGPRQVGKTFLLKEIHDAVQKKGKSARYFNLEIPRDSSEFNKSESDLFDMLTSYDFVFIDEFHYLMNATKLFKAIYDSEANVKIYASGSSSIEIHKHLKESLAGRAKKTHIFPLTFDEFKTGFPDKNPESLLDEYLTFGGLPGIYKESNPDKRIVLLNEIMENYIQKDIKSLIKEENIRAYNSLLYLIAQSQGQVVSAHSLANEVNLTVKTIERYLSVLEATFILYPLHSYAKNIGNELKKSRKFYLYDLGIWQMLLKDFDPDSKDKDGAKYEIFVHNEWKARLKPNQELMFWRNRQHQEIDFVLLEDRKPTIMEVKTRQPPTIPSVFNTFFKHYPNSVQGVVYFRHRENEDQLVYSEIGEKVSVLFRDIVNSVSSVRNVFQVFHSKFSYKPLGYKYSASEGFEILKKLYEQEHWLSQVMIRDFEEFALKLQLPFDPAWQFSFLLESAMRSNLLLFLEKLKLVIPDSDIGRLTKQYEEDLNEKWFFQKVYSVSSEMKSSHDKWLGKVMELLYAAQLKKMGWCINQMEATGGRCDIQATRDDQQVLGIEVKNINFDPDLFKAFKDKGKSVVSAASPIRYWFLRLTEAAFQFQENTDYQKMAVLVLEDDGFASFQRLIKDSFTKFDIEGERWLPKLQELYIYFMKEKMKVEANDENWKDNFVKMKQIVNRLDLISVVLFNRNEIAFENETVFSHQKDGRWKLSK